MRTAAAIPQAADPEASARGLVLRAATALGVATEPDLRDYYRLGPARSRQAVAELVEAGALEPVVVRGWRHPAYRLPGARTPRKVMARALLSHGRLLRQLLPAVDQTLRTLIAGLSARSCLDPSLGASLDEVIREHG